MAINKKQAAEIEIAAILKQLEVETGRTVQSLEICSLQIHKINEFEPDHVMEVSISLCRMAGNGWGK